MIAPSHATLLSYLHNVYLPSRPNVGDAASVQYAVAVHLLDEHAGHHVHVRELSAELLLSFVRWLHESGRAPRTVNGRRQSILTLWRDAHERGYLDAPPPNKRQVPKLTEPKRVPVAWTVEEMRRLVDACRHATPLPRFKPHAWDARHWVALVLTIWDTGHRLSALLDCRRDAVSGGWLRVPAELTKSRTEAVHELAAQTIDVIDRLPPHEMLLPWPFGRRQIWVRFERDVLIPAGLPYDRRRKFHCLRKASVSHVAAVAGEYAAMIHAGHTSIDVTRQYIDPRIAGNPVSAARILPRL